MYLIISIKLDFIHRIKFQQPKVRGKKQNINRKEEASDPRFGDMKRKKNLSQIKRKQT